MTSDATRNQVGQRRYFQCHLPTFQFPPFTKLDVALTKLDGNIQLSHGSSLVTGCIFLASHQKPKG